VFLTDSGDNVTASTPGDLPIVLRHLLERKVQARSSPASMTGQPPRNVLRRALVRKLRLSIGASIEKRFGPPLDAEMEVVRLVNRPRSQSVAWEVWK